MSYHATIGKNLGITYSATIDATRRGDVRTHWLTLWRLHVIVTRLL
jgi:hypothetical protein